VRREKRGKIFVLTWEFEKSKQGGFFGYVKVVVHRGLHNEMYNDFRSYSIDIDLGHPNQITHNEAQLIRDCTKVFFVTARSCLS
jgi:hypothetical protein